jgi:hypothetical protein
MAQRRIFDPMEQTTSLMDWRPGDDTFVGLERA